METQRLHFPALVGWVGVGLALALSVVIVALRAGGEMSILGDEWHYAYWMSTDGALDQGFNPDKGRYAIPVPFLVYQPLFELFGADSYVPFRVAMIVFLGLVTALAYELMRRRIGYGLALVPAALIPLFGSAGEVVVNSFRMPGMISLAAGLGAVLALEERSRARDILAAGLLIVAVASHPLGLAFVAAAAVLRARSFLEGEDRLATAALVAAPTLFFAAVLRPDTEREESLTSQFADLPEYFYEGLRGLFNALGGLYAEGLVPFDSVEGARSVLGVIAAAIFFGLMVWAVWRRRWDAVFGVALVAAALVVLAGPAFGPGDRPPNLGRYIFPAGVCILIALADLARGLPGYLARRDRVALAAGAVIAFVSACALIGNTAELDAEAERFARNSTHVRAQAAALEAVRDQDPLPDLKIDREGLLGEKFRFSIKVGEYYVVSDDYGTPAWSPDELAAQEPEVQETARASERIALGEAP